MFFSPLIHAFLEKNLICIPKPRLTQKSRNSLNQGPLFYNLGLYDFSNLCWKPFPSLTSEKMSLCWPSSRFLGVHLWASVLIPLAFTVLHCCSSSRSSLVLLHHGPRWPHSRASTIISLLMLQKASQISESLSLFVHSFNITDLTISKYFFNWISSTLLPRSSPRTIYSIGFTMSLFFFFTTNYSSLYVIIILFYALLSVNISHLCLKLLEFSWVSSFSSYTKSNQRSYDSSFYFGKLISPFIH